MMNESAENVTTTSSHLTMKKLKDVILNRIKDDHQNQRVMKEQVGFYIFVVKSECYITISLPETFHSFPLLDHNVKRRFR